MFVSKHHGIKHFFPLKVTVKKMVRLLLSGMLPLIGILTFISANPLSAQNASQYSVEASVTPSQIKIGEDVLVTYTFKILRGSPTLWRIRIPWSGNVYVKTVEKNNQSMWLINRSESAPQSSVVSWIHEPVQRYLELKSYSGDVKSTDLVTVIFAMHAPDSLSTKSFDGWVGDTGSPVLLNRCISKSTEIKVVAAQ